MKTKNTSDSLKNKLAFATADIFGGGSFNIINFLYPGFLALTVGISPFWSGFIMLVARIWDAVSDPVMGRLSDATKSRLGKRRIYLVVASPLILVAMFLLFYPFAFSSLTLRIIAVLTSYLIFTTVQTMVMIPYYSLSSEISRDYQKRAVYNSYRLGFSIFSSIICVAVPALIVNLFADERLGFQIMSLTFGLLFGLSVLVTGIFAKEEIITEPIRQKFSFKQLFEPLSLKAFRQYLGMFMVLQMAMAIMSGLFFFYINFYIAKDITLAGENNIIGLLAAALMFTTQIFALPLYLQLIKIKSKAFAYRVGAVIWIICGFLLFFIPANASPWLIYVLAIAMGFGISGPGLVPHTMFGDIVDVGQLQFNKRIEGQMSGFTNFINKVAQAVGLALMMNIIGLAGFKEQDLTQPPILSQPDSALLAIRLTLMLAPLIFMSIGILISFRYKIDQKKQIEIQELINNKQKIQD